MAEGIEQLDWNPVAVTALITAVSALLTVFATKFVPAVVNALIKWQDSSHRRRREQAEMLRKERADMLALQDEAQEIDDGLRYYIRKQDKRISEIEKELRAVRLDHQKCVQEQTRSEVHREQLEREIRSLRSKLGENDNSPS